MIWWHWRQHLIAGFVLVASAYLVADLVALLMGASLEASMPAQQQRPVGEQAPLPTSANIDAILRGNLFHPDQRGYGATPSPTQAPVAVESTHRLVGTVMGSGTFGFAVLEEKSSKTQVLYRINDLLPGGAELVEIGRYEVLIRVGSSTHRLAVEGDVPAAAAVSAPSAGGVREVTANRWLIDRRKVEAALANLPQLMTQARLIPNTSGGKADGWRVLSIKQGSFFSDIGLQEGDILKRINGVEIADPQTMLRAFMQLQNEENINLDLQRRTQPVTFAYEVR